MTSIEPKRSEMLKMSSSRHQRWHWGSGGWGEGRLGAWGTS